MKDSSIGIELYRITKGMFKSDASYKMMGAFEIPFESNILCVISDDGLESKWEHVSVSLKNRCPNWREMCFIKDLFWNEEEIVIQYHPPKSKYINNHPNVLHLWKQIGKEIELPPSILVGIKTLTPAPKDKGEK